MNRIVKFVFAVMLAGPLACAGSSDSSSTSTGGSGSTGGTTGSPAQMAEHDFWNAMWSGDLDAGAAAGVELKAVLDANPQSFYDNLLMGMQADWQIAEAQRNPMTIGQTIQTYAPIAGQYLGTAHGVNPRDVFTTSLLGQLTFAQGAQMQDLGTMDAGLQLLNEAYAQDPQLGFFVPVVVALQMPQGDPFIQQAVDHAWSYYSGCAGSPIDPNNPDFSAFIAQVNAHPTGLCGPVMVAPHWLEGALLTFGDLLVKTGDVMAAKKAYQAASQVSSYAAWPHHDAVDSRLSADLDARAQAYQGPQNEWPGIGASPFSCGVCHNQ